MEALARVDAVIAKISDRLSEYGALTNHLEHAYSNVLNTHKNLTKAESQLRDTDIAGETVKLKKKRPNTPPISPIDDGSGESDEPGDIGVVEIKIF